MSKNYSTTNNSTEYSYNTNNNNQNNHDFKESVNTLLDTSNNQILLYALDSESGNTNLVTIPL